MKIEIEIMFKSGNKKILSDIIQNENEIDNFEKIFIDKITIIKIKNKIIYLRPSEIDSIEITKIEEDIVMDYDYNEIKSDE